MRTAAPLVPQRLFTSTQAGMGPTPIDGFNPAYDATRDGTRFVVMQNQRQPGGR